MVLNGLRVNRRGWLRRLALLGSGTLAAELVQAQRESPLALLYPEIGEPFRAVFAKIIEGIDERLPQRSFKLAIAAEADPAVLASELRRREPKVVIALGRAGLRVAAAMEKGVELVAGGVIGPGEAEGRIGTLLSLAPDPLLLLQRLRVLQPNVRRVHLAYSSRHSGWLLRWAQEAARQTGLELRAVEVDELKSALRLYQDVLAQATSQDALWLPQDPVAVDDSAVLPLVLQECWNRNVPLFSSNVAHVRRGALFSLYPNNLELGRSLGAAGLAALRGGSASARGLVPLREVHAALNTRTASHLGLELSVQQQRSFELLLPER